MTGCFMYLHCQPPGINDASLTDNFSAKIISPLPVEIFENFRSAFDSLAHLQHEFVDHPGGPGPGQELPGARRSPKSYGRIFSF